MEEIPEVGSYITYNICGDSILIVRTAEGDGPDAIKAYHNVCPHRGRRLVGDNTGGGPVVVKQAKGAHSACGKQAKFGCNYHAWTFELDGKASYIPDREDWGGALTETCTSLTPVKVGSWGGWLWINMDPEAGPLSDYLEPISTLLDPFQFDKMRYRFRFWGIFDCNWKVALEAFLEPYHVQGTHPQLLKYGDFYSFSKTFGLHGQTGFDSKQHREEGKAVDTSVHRAAGNDDPRITIARMQQEYWDTIGASTSETLVRTAQRLPEELPEGTPAAEVHKYWLAKAKAEDAARGVIWPEITDAQYAAAGLALSIFPNMNLIPGPTFSLYYRCRPYGSDPDKCIYEAVALDRFPEGEEPKTEWTYVEQDTRQMAAGDRTGHLEHGGSPARLPFARLQGQPPQPVAGAQGDEPALQPRQIHGHGGATPAQEIDPAARACCLGTRARQTMQCRNGDGVAPRIQAVWAGIIFTCRPADGR